MSITIKIEAFEGPLDLLLHLIKKSKVDIYNIPIFEITEQYINYLKAMEELDLEIASEFIVMAATLLEIKSKMLLPKIKPENEEAADLDPRKELVEKLVEYKKYKEFANKLREKSESYHIYFKQPEIIDDIDDNKDVLLKNITLENIMKAFNKVLNNYEKRFNQKFLIPENIDHDEYKIEDKMDEILKVVKLKKKMKFNDFFVSIKSNLEIIVIFLAMLELIKLRNIIAYQDSNFGDIIIEGME
ncbi:Segregation and condensation protein A [Caloramator mitchellensis]|uniref:Segregation and condensation protein A n=1 Tax=Caloramator mitchellensis TaxID=908809 RepID=A0A0R3K1I1_CALMK|nr:segregation/condensation protein A [Caloramator mitchellensis]KRQ86805.1 Segregation and condensation protein A [Caloramator mitchellensis]